jgi:hypothetical protein
VTHSYLPQPLNETQLIHSKENEFIMRARKSQEKCFLAVNGFTLSNFVFAFSPPHTTNEKKCHVGKQQKRAIMSYHFHQKQYKRKCISHAQIDFASKNRPHRRKVKWGKIFLYFFRGNLYIFTLTAAQRN